jgi:MFS family permease
MMTFLMGVTVGGLVSGLVSDKFGRKRTLSIFLGVQVCQKTLNSNENRVRLRSRFLAIVRLRKAHQSL